MLYTGDELEWQYQMIENAVANHRLEGFELDEEIIEDARRIVRGEITTDDVIKKILAEIKNSQQ